MCHFNQIKKKGMTHMSKESFFDFFEEAGISFLCLGTFHKPLTLINKARLEVFKEKMKIKSEFESSKQDSVSLSSLKLQPIKAGSIKLQALSLRTGWANKPLTMFDEARLELFEEEKSSQAIAK